MPNEPFYSSMQWIALRSKVRSKWLRDGRPCGMCGKALVKSDKVLVDHITPRSKAPHLALDEHNLQLLHWSCHNTKTHRHERLNMTKIGLNGMPEGTEWS